MKSSRAIVMLVLSVMAGLAAVILAARWLSQQAVGPAQHFVVVASRDVNLGQPITPAMVELVPWPGSAIPKGAFDNVSNLDGRVLRMSLQRGEPVLESRLAPVGTRGGLSAVIADGKRAITVRVNEVVGVAGFALPGNFVDVMVSTRDNQQRAVSKIVLERIMVLAVAQEASRDDTKPRLVNAVTLEVSPDQAERLDLARSVGTLSLVLRNQIDSIPAPTTGVRTADLLGLEEPKTSAPAQAPARRIVRATVAPQPAAKPDDSSTVEVIRGMHRAATKL
jgi:pilus assembly protein CpaB